MTTELDLTRAVRDWLEDGPTAIPDRVLDAVMDQVPQTPRRRRPWLALVPLDRRRARLVQLVAVLVILAILAAGLLVGVGAIRRAPSGPFELPTGEQPLPVGRYAIGLPFPWPLAIDVPDGWSTSEVLDRWIALSSSGPAPGELILTSVEAIYADPCHQERGLLAPFGPSAADLATVLYRVPGLLATPPHTTLVGGYPAFRMTITMPASFDGCGEPPPGFRVWALPGEDPLPEESQTDHLWIVDAGATRLVIHGLAEVDTPVAIVAQMETMVESIAFGERAVLPAPSHEATPLPSEAPFASLPADGPVAEAAYLTTMTLYEFDASGASRAIRSRDEVVFRGPGGWIRSGSRLLSDDDGPPDASFGWWAIRRVYADPCRWQASGIADSRTIGDASNLATAIALAHEVEPVELPWIGGLSRFMEIVIPKDIDPAACDGQQYRLWEDHGGHVRTAFPGERIRVRVVDFDPGIAVVEYASMPEASSSTMAALLDSGAALSIIRVSGP